jgi:hypothetical protein
MRNRTLRFAITAVTTAGLSVGVATAAGASSRHHSPAKSAKPDAVTTVLQGSRLSHRVGASTETLSNPDDIVTLGGRLFVGFQNGVGAMGEPSGTGNTASTLVEFTPGGHVVNQWDLAGRIDGMGADPAHHRVIVTVDEDGNTSLSTVTFDDGGNRLEHYAYSPSPLPHGGGTDAVSIYHRQILISASAPADTTRPAVYSVMTATATPVFFDNATATSATTGQTTTLALSDPDSNGVVPGSSPRFAGDFMLDSQGDLKQIYAHDAGGPSQSLTVLSLTQSVDDTAWATARTGVLYATDATNNAVSAVHGRFRPGDAFVAVTPCNANNAPATCPAPGFSANYLGRLDLSSGTVNPVTTTGAPLVPKGLLFIASDDNSGD